MFIEAFNGAFGGAARRSLRIEAVCPSPDTARVAVAGEIDLATAAALRDGLLAAVRDHTPAVVDVDLSEVTFLDCTGIGALIAVRNIVVGSGCRLRVIRPQPFVRQVLELTGVLPLLTGTIDQTRVSPTPAPSPHTNHRRPTSLPTPHPSAPAMRWEATTG